MTTTDETVRARMAKSPGAALIETQIFRRAVSDNDVKIRINYCGVCHTDLHLVNDDWGISNYPLVPGHEIIGEVIETGAGVQGFQPGDVVGVGPFVNSCDACRNCEAGQQQYCSEGPPADAGGITWRNVIPGTA